MKPKKGQQESVSIFQALTQKLAEKLPEKTKPFFLSLTLGILLAVAIRRTVTAWLQAAQISNDFRQIFYHMPNIGRNSSILFDMMWGWGKQELRLLESNEAATTLNMMLYNMTELSTWDRNAEELVDRRCRPWDDADRRPSHVDRRNFLRHGILANEFYATVNLTYMPKKIIIVLQRLLKLAA